MMSDLLADVPIALTVRELNQMADSLLDGQLTGLWISGEISNLIRAASGHYYFSLKDPHAQIRCTLFKFAATRLAMPLREGAQVEVRGKIGVYAARGEFQINVQEVRQVGAGALFLQFEQLKTRLHAEGLFSETRKRALPKFPQQIGIVTSLAAAALRDVVSTLKRRAPHIPLIVYPCAVQGAGSSLKIAQAIEIANQRDEVDVLIVCRGGGSLEDLWAFNEEITVRAIAGSRLPIINGVGHETDFTLSDMAADVRAPTPTAAAEMVCASRRELQQQLAQCANLLWHDWQKRHQNAVQTLNVLEKQLLHPLQRHQQRKQQMANVSQQLRLAFLQQIQRHRQQLDQLSGSLNANLLNIDQYKQQLDDLNAQLPLVAQQQVQRNRDALQHLAAQLESVSPLAALKRGFAMVHDRKQRVVRSRDEVQLGQKLTVHWENSQIQVQVINHQQMDLFDNNSAE